MNLNVGQRKSEIAQVSETSLADVNTLISGYKNMKYIQEFLRKRKEAGEELPDDQNQLFNLFRKDGGVPKFEARRQRKNYRLSKKHRKIVGKYGFEALQR